MLRYTYPFHFFMGEKAPNLVCKSLAEKLMKTNYEESKLIDLLASGELSVEETDLLSFSRTKLTFNIIFKKIFIDRTFIRAYYRSYGVVYRVLKFTFEEKDTKASLSYTILKAFTILIFFLLRRVLGFPLRIIIDSIHFGHGFGEGFYMQQKDFITLRFKLSLADGFISYQEPAMSLRIFKSEKSKLNFNPKNTNLSKAQVFYNSVSAVQKQVLPPAKPVIYRVGPTNLAHMGYTYGEGSGWYHTKRDSKHIKMILAGGVCD
jgi:hypothetical protein